MSLFVCLRACLLACLFVCEFVCFCVCSDVVRVLGSEYCFIVWYHLRVCLFLCMFDCRLVSRVCLSFARRLSVSVSLLLSGFTGFYVCLLACMRGCLLACLLASVSVVRRCVIAYGHVVALNSTGAV